MAPRLRFCQLSDQASTVCRIALEVVENAGVTGPEKYAEAGIKITSETLPWQAAAPGTQ